MGNVITSQDLNGLTVLFYPTTAGERWMCTCECASLATCDGMTGYGKCLCGHMAAEMVLIGRHSVLGGGTMAGMWRDDPRHFITRHIFT